MNTYHRVSLLIVLLAISNCEGQIVSFTMKGPQIQDSAFQTIQCELDAERTIRQHSQVVNTSKQQLRRLQVRTVTILELQGNQAVRAKIEFQRANTEIQAQNNGKVDVQQPIEGNAYLVTRQDEKLIITDLQHQPVSPEEDKLLRTQLAAFGKPNPLSQFLHGKQIAVGSSIDVPEAVAAELLGLTGNQGKTDNLSLRLTKLADVGQSRCAVFETLLRTHSEESSISLLMKGELIIEPNSCRTRSINLHGPIAASEMRGPAQGRFTVSTNGSLKVNVTNQHQSGGTRTAIRKSTISR